MSPDRKEGRGGRFVLSDVRPLLEARGFRRRRSLGQNFLCDPNTLRSIAEAAESSRSDSILEVGTGPGLLTQYLAEVAGAVWSIEIDPVLFEVASTLLEGLPDVHLLLGDVLAGKQRIDRAILERIPDPPDAGGVMICVSNLPYATAVPIIIGLLESEDRIDRMVVTVQQEVADRFLAGPGDRAYGVFTVLAHLRAEVSPIRKVAAGAFWPVPEVESAVLRIRRRVPAPDLSDYLDFKRFLRGLYTQRRKTLLRGLAGNPAWKTPSEAARAALQAVEVRPEDRVETLEPERILRLFRALREIGS